MTSLDEMSCKEVGLLMSNSTILWAVSEMDDSIFKSPIHEIKGNYYSNGLRIIMYDKEKADYYKSTKNPKYLNCMQSVAANRVFTCKEDAEKLTHDINKLSK